MPNKLVIGALLVCALKALPSSGDCPSISLSGTETVAAAPRPQAAAASTETKTSKAQAIAKAPKPCPELLTIDKMLKATERMRELQKVFTKSWYTLMNDSTPVGRDPRIRIQLEKVRYYVFMNQPTDLWVHVRWLKDAWIQVSQEKN